MIPSFREALRFWFKLGLISFGGPAGQIAIMHRELVDRRKWVTESQFLHALNYCMLLPGPEAQQLATYLGWRMHGIRGGVVAGVLFILPSAFLLWGLSWIYVEYGAVPWVASVFYGLKCAVLAIVFDAVLRVGNRALKHPVMWSLAALAFGLIYFLKVPFPAVVVGAAVVGFMGAKIYPKIFASAGHGAVDEVPTAGARPSIGRSCRIAGVCLILWMLPVLVVWGWLGTGSTLFAQAAFFSKAALVTFGGAYAVLPYVAQHAVEAYWVTPPQMLAGMALAETTPGPLIMVLQFVGFLGGWHQPDFPQAPLLSATACAALTTWCTFLPSFLFILAGAPYVESMRGMPRLNGALAAITASVVGVMLNLAVWFTLSILWPMNGVLDGTAFALALASFGAIRILKWEVAWVVLAGGVAGWCVNAMGWVA
jgi:chromate transporter